MENTLVSISGCAFHSILLFYFTFLGIKFINSNSAVSAIGTFFMLAVFKDEFMSQEVDFVVDQRKLAHYYDHTMRHDFNFER